MDAFRQFTHIDPEKTEHLRTVALAYINQSAHDIKKKLQKVERLGEKQFRDLIEIAEKVYNNRDTVEDKQIKAEKRQN